MVLLIIQIKAMNAISKFMKEHEKFCLGVSVLLLGAYLFFRQLPPRPKKNNMLDTTLEKLMANSKHANITKIVITTSHASKGFFRRNLINFLKLKLTENNIKMLINCSPQKLLKAGCECFLESMESNDTDYIHYYYNALKAQYLIEDTITSIELINCEQGSGPIVMICDNNPFDIKLMNESDNLWTQTLNRYNIEERQIVEGYDIIFHCIENDSDPAQDKRIKEVWEKHPHYYPVNAEEARPGNEEVFEIIQKFLERSFQKPVLGG